TLRRPADQMPRRRRSPPASLPPYSQYVGCGLLRRSRISIVADAATPDEGISTSTSGAHRLSGRRGDLGARGAGARAAVHRLPALGHELPVDRGRVQREEDGAEVRIVVDGGVG